MRTVARWTGCLMLIGAGPYVLSLLLVWIVHDDPRVLTGRVGAWTSLILIWATGLFGVHLLPLGTVTRALVSLVYTPVAVVMIFLGLLTAACGWYGACP